MEPKKFIPHSSPTISEQAIRNVVEVMHSGFLGFGDQVVAFENKTKDYLGKQYAVATSNGFAAIHLALIGMGIGEGDEVIFPSYSGPSILNPIRIEGATPVLVDIEPNGFNISVEDTRRKITPRTKAIIVPHILGFSAHIDEIVALGVPVIEDCAQSLGATYKGKRHGSFSESVILSFNNTKMMSTGDGGMLLTDNKQVNEAALNHRWYGYKKQHRYVAYNYQLNNIAAAIGIDQLDNLSAFVEKRKQIAAVYNNHFAGHNDIFIDFEHSHESVFYRYPIYIQHRDEVKKALADQGIGCGYGVLEGMHELMDCDVKDFPNTIDKLDHILSIPIYPLLSLEDAAYIARQVIATVDTIKQNKAKSL
jgi:perosamine synthetase